MGGIQKEKKTGRVRKSLRNLRNRCILRLGLFISNLKAKPEDMMGAVPGPRPAEVTKYKQEKAIPHAKHVKEKPVQNMEEPALNEAVENAWQQFVAREVPESEKKEYILYFHQLRNGLSTEEKELLTEVLRRRAEAKGRPVIVGGAAKRPPKKHPRKKLYLDHLRNSNPKFSTELLGAE